MLPGADLKQRVLIALSSHGFGHLGQTAPIIDALRQRRPNVRLVVRSRLPEFKLREKLGDDIEIQVAELDIGIVQKDALNIDVEATADRYATFHQQWEALLEREKQALRDIRPDLIVANIPYLTLAAAQQLNIPNLAFCSLNWAELYQYFFSARPESEHILEQMLEAYNRALCFLQPAPAMRMPGIDNGVAIGPVAQLGADVSGALRRRLGIDAATALLLFSVGGMEIRTPCDDWPRFPGLHLLVPEAWNSRHPDTTALESLGYCFADLMRSCDVLIAKPGYGSFVEAACLGKPVLYLPRPNWPEAPILIDWLQQHGRCMELQHADFHAGALAGPVGELLDRTAPGTITPSGIQAAVDTICGYL
jgi:hypothetical protein